MVGQNSKFVRFLKIWKESVSKVEVTKMSKIKDSPISNILEWNHSLCWKLTENQILTLFKDQLAYNDFLWLHMLVFGQTPN